MPEPRAVFNYLPVDRPDPEVLERLAASAAVEPILKRWRHHCSEGLIDEAGKIRHVFTRAQPGSENTVSRVIRELSDVPEAVADFEAALAAARQVDALAHHAVEMPVRNARLLEDASLEGCGFQLERHTSRVTDWEDEQQLADVYYDEAAKYLRARDGTPIEANLAMASRFRVSAYKPLSSIVADSNEEGRVVAMIDYYEIDSGVIRTLRDEQLWWYDTEVKRWFLGSPLPNFDGG